MKLTDRAHKTMTDVSEASKTVISTTEWATIALIAVTMVSVMALGIGITALTRGNK